MTLPPRWQWKLDRWREQIAALFRGKEEAPRPKLCPSCGTLVGSTATKCHECGTSLTFSLAAASRGLSAMIPTESPVTYAILIINVILFGLSLLLTMKFSEGFNLVGNIAGQVLDRMGASQPWIWYTHEYWRWVMPIFLHGGLWHIGFNAFALMDIGPQVEEQYGSSRYLFLYLVTGAFGFVVSSWWGNYSIGASGSLCGLIGLMLAITYRHSGAMMRALRAQLVKWIIYIVVFGFFWRADHAAHFGGLAAGFVLGRWIFDDRQPATGAERKRAYLLGWIAALLILASFGFMFVNFMRTAS